MTSIKVTLNSNTKQTENRNHINLVFQKNRWTTRLTQNHNEQNSDQTGLTRKIQV